jgi:hypothetical protein
MAREFSSATAEQVVAAVEAAVVSQKGTDAAFAAAFAELPPDQAEAALKLAADLGLLKQKTLKFVPDGPLAVLLASPKEQQRGAVLRVALESYEPFRVFRERLLVTGTPAIAARQTKTLLDLDAHHETIKDTLVNLGTYTQALTPEGGGRYGTTEKPLENTLQILAKACGDLAASEAAVRKQIGAKASEAASREEVILPLAEALRYAAEGDGRSAVLRAGNAVESYLSALGVRTGVALTGATGINAKLDRFDSAKTLPKKLVHMGKYLGHVRNAADHGTDPDVGASWTIRPETGIEYFYVACSFILVSTARVNAESPLI